MDLAKRIELFRRSPQDSGFLLDFDGTLSNIVENPYEAVPFPGAREVLSDLAAKYGLVAVQSARPAQRISELLAIPEIRYLGIYGAEEVRSGQLIQPPEADRWRGMASRLARDAEAFIFTEGLEGCSIEFKDIALSIHYRGSLNLRAGEILLTWAADAANKRGFIASGGRKVVELRPEGVTKSDGVERLGHSVSRLLVAGDDAADVEAMKHGRAIFGDAILTVGVLSKEAPGGLEEASSVTVKSVPELISLLRKFL